jgi:membrane fusion protein, multidrug efflux system
MKRALIVVSVILALAALAGWAWLRRSVGSDQEAEIETDVAVRVGKITRATLREYVTAYGVVEPEPSGARPAASARITSSVAGLIRSVRCAEGQYVREGTVLFQLDSRLADLASDKAQQAVTAAQTTLERQQKLIQADGTSQKALLEAEQALANARGDLASARVEQTRLRVEAPFGGVLAHIDVRPGESVDPSTTLAELVDTARLVVGAGVPSAELAALRVGQRVELSTDPPAAAALTSVVSFISPQVDIKTGTALVRAALPERCALRPGQLVTLRIVTAERKDRLAAPVESLVKDDQGATVIALVKEGRAVQTPVRAGLRDGDLVEVEAEGLQAGMSVVTDGSYALPKETKIRVLGQ